MRPSATNRSGREVDDATVADALVFVESRHAALAPFPAGSNDLTIPIRDGIDSVIGPEHIRGELSANTRPVRSSPEQITLSTSVGVAVQDDVAARVIRAAHVQGVGQDLEPV
jgi:alanine dehydrogenase